MILAKSQSQVRLAAPSKEGEKEGWTLDLSLAMISILYLLLMMPLFFWLLFDTWIGRNSIPALLGYPVDRLNTPEYRLVIYSILGGGIGGILNGIRSFLRHFPKFKWRFTWKYITLPWTGSILGLIVHVLIQSSISIIGGGTNVNVSATQALSNFGIGSLAGYGSRDVLIWLDSKVTNLFKVTEDTNNGEGQPNKANTAQPDASPQEAGEAVKKDVT